MIAVALKGLLGRKLRAALTGFAIVLGVAMISGTLVLTDTIGKSFDGIYGQSYKDADAVVSARDAVSSNGPAPAFSADVLRRVQDVPGVAAAEGAIEDSVRLVDGRGETIGTEGAAFGVSRSGAGLDPLQLVGGTWPSGRGEIAVDKSTADEQGFAVGDTVGAFADGPLHRYRVSGIVRFGTADSLAGATITVFDLPTAQRLFGKQGKLDTIRLRAESGVSGTTLAARVAPLLPEAAQVRTASAQASSDSKDTQDGVSWFRTFLLAFGGIALVVGSSVIANTLSITVSQRIRELATLRTLGASRRQVLSSVVIEALAIGFLASVAGLFFGLGLAKGLFALLAATGVDLPEAGLVFAGRTVAVSLAAGTLIALVASLRPALRATRVQPISAVREGAVLPPSRFARFKTANAIVVGAASAALLGYAMLSDGLSTKAQLLTLGVGALLLFRAVSMVAPRLIRPLAHVLGAPGARLGGTAGQLARQNAMRNPSRTAATAGALMIGLSVITFVAVLGQGVKAAFSSSVNELFIADYALRGDNSPLTSQAALAAAAAPGVEVVSEIRSGEGRVAGAQVAVSGVDANLTKVVGMRWAGGSGNVPAQLGRDGAFVKRVYAGDHDLAVGSPLRLKTPTGTVLRLRVVGIFDEPKGGSPFGDVSISTGAFDGSFASRDNEFTLVNVTGDPSPERTAALEGALAAFPDARVETRDEFKDGQIAGLTSVLNIVYALLGLSVIVSLFGIVNTLVLSVFERTRELGMLRAIGMTRRQVRRMVRHESIVTALIGATFGIAIGMVLAALFAHALSAEGVAFAVPYGSLAVFVALAVLAGVLAAILPARRAARLNVLEALQYE